MSTSIARCLLLCAAVTTVLHSGDSAAQSLDACELDLDLLGQVVGGECDIQQRSAGWGRFGFDPAGSGLLTAGVLSATTSIVPADHPDIRVARLQPTQPVVWLALEDARATLIPDEWLDVVVLRPSPGTFAITIVHWQTQGLSSSVSPLVQSATLPVSGPLTMSVGWVYAGGQLTLTVSGFGGMPLTVTRSGFGTSLPWLSLPHFPTPTAEFQSASLVSVSGSTP